MAGPEAARITPPSAGPARVPMFSVESVALLAATSSSGVRTSDGRSDHWAERLSVEAAPWSPASA